MRDLFDRILKEGELAIDQLVRDHQQEGVQLDFKTKRSDRSGAATDDDIRNLGKELSAFSNSMGGMIIWGVEARKSQESGIDCASALKPIVDIEQFKNDFSRRLGQVLMPRNESVLIESVPSQQHPGAGYLLVYVDRSERRPHRSEVSGDKQYYKRVGDSAYAMEHYDIEDSFKRFTVPELFVESYIDGVVALPLGDGIIKRNIDIGVVIKNDSAVSARFPYLLLDEISGGANSPYGADGNGKYGLAMTEDRGVLRFEGGSNDVIHPGNSRTITKIRTEFSGVVSQIVHGNGSLTYSVKLSMPLDINIAYRVGSENSRISSGVITVTKIELLKKIASSFPDSTMFIDASTGQPLQFSAPILRP